MMKHTTTVQARTELGLMHRCTADLRVTAVYAADSCHFKSRILMGGTRGLYKHNCAFNPPTVAIVPHPRRDRVVRNSLSYFSATSTAYTVYSPVSA